MFAEPIANDEHRISSPFWSDHATHSQKLPAIFTSRHDKDVNLTGLSEDVDKDQEATKLLSSMESPHVKSVSSLEALDFSVFASPTVSSSSSQEDFNTSDLCLSPAAMFLSSFSPVMEPERFPDDEGEIVAGYTLGPIIGYGGFSTIRRASSQQGGVVAVKIVRRSDISKQSDPEQARRHLDHERQVWSSLNHEHILPLFTSSHTPYADFFIMLYCPAGSLFDILKRDGRPALPQDDAGMMFRQVVRGMRYLHEVAGIVHGDMKLENVLVDEMGVCRIGDFGMARKIGEFDSSDDWPVTTEVVEHHHRHHHEDGEHPKHGLGRAQTLRASHSAAKSKISHSRQGGAALPVHLSLIRHHSGLRYRNSSPYPSTEEIPHVLPNPTYQPGSLPYASPELLLPPSSTQIHPRPNPAQDIWALGVMLYTLLTGRLPFTDSFEPRLQMKILHGVYEVPEGIGRGAERVLAGCLERSVPNRWTIAMVDEVAWGIGWGSAGDDALEPSPPHPRSRPSPMRESAIADDPDCSRSPSRPARSMSRSTSAVRETSRSASRSAAHPYHHSHHHPHQHYVHPHPPLPSLSGLSDAILRSISSSSSSSSSSSLPSDTAVSMQEEIVDKFERGRSQRQPTKLEVTLSFSRSPSHQELPPTPKDVSRVRGRKPSPRHPGDPHSSRPFSPQSALDTSSSELDTVDESSSSNHDWPPMSPEEQQAEGRSASRSSSYDPSLSYYPSTEVSRLRATTRAKETRPGSMPPAPGPSLSSWTRPDLGSLFGSGEVSRSTPRPIPADKSARSRSVGFEALDRRTTQPGHSWGCN